MPVGDLPDEPAEHETVPAIRSALLAYSPSLDGAEPDLAALRRAERTDIGQVASLERRHTHHLDLARAYAIRRDDLAAAYMLARADHEIPEESRLNVLFRAVLRELAGRETATTRALVRPLAERLGIA